ncbi:MAG: hypothetical protein GX347_03850 [Epulopiscium sp.]|nr:hypothetical protein [Candidatus Epulonipiscium sp.]
MAMIKRNPQYLKEQKKKYIFYTFILLVLMLSNYVFGLWLTKTSKNIFTIVSVFFILGVAQMSARLVVYLPYKDPQKDWLDQFKDLPESYILWNSALITNGQKNAYFDSLLISNSKIYCLKQIMPSKSEQLETIIISIFEKRGLEDSLEFIYGNQKVSSLISQLKKKQCTNISQQKEFIRIIRMYSL